MAQFPYTTQKAHSNSKRMKNHKYVAGVICAGSPASVARLYDACYWNVPSAKWIALLE